MRARRAVQGLVVGLCWAPAVALAQSSDGDLSSSLRWFAILAGLALLPVLLVMVTSFVKVVVVLGILRSALGLQGVPPMQIIVGLALILTLFIMAPVGLAMADAASRSLRESAATGVEHAPGEAPGETSDEMMDALTWERVSLAALAAAEPLRQFLSEQAHPRDRALFAELGAGADDGGGTGVLGSDGLAVLTPAFVVSELKEAFQIGFLLFIPFLVIDLVVASILLSLGMVMLSPTTVSLPFKLLLFVLVDGWYLLARGLVSSYQVL